MWWHVVAYIISYAQRKIKANLHSSGKFDREDSETHTITPGDWRMEQQPQGTIPIEHKGSNRNPQSLRDIREYLVKYFISIAGSVPWQDNII